jgi:hypothetical protein
VSVGRAGSPFVSAVAAGPVAVTASLLRGDLCGQAGWPGGHNMTVQGEQTGSRVTTDRRSVACSNSPAASAHVLTHTTCRTCTHGPTRGGLLD